MPILTPDQARAVDKTLKEIKAQRGTMIAARLIISDRPILSDNTVQHSYIMVRLVGKQLRIGEMEFGKIINHEIHQDRHAFSKAYFPKDSQTDEDEP